HGTFRFLRTEGALLVYERRLGEDCVVIAVNRSDQTAQGLTLELSNAVDQMTGKAYENSGSLSVVLAPMSAVILSGTNKSKNQL
ncbi:MAG: alpha-glucosidase C-terminal domain-containing protein, partial [Butyricicoccaceae bacterium]